MLGIFSNIERSKICGISRRIAKQLNDCSRSESDKNTENRMKENALKKRNLKYHKVMYDVVSPHRAGKYILSQY